MEASTQHSSRDDKKNDLEHQIACLNRMIDCVQLVKQAERSVSVIQSRHLLNHEKLEQKKAIVSDSHVQGDRLKVSSVEGNDSRNRNQENIKSVKHEVVGSRFDDNSSLSEGVADSENDIKDMNYEKLDDKVRSSTCSTTRAPSRNDFDNRFKLELESDEEDELIGKFDRQARKSFRRASFTDMDGIQEAIGGQLSGNKTNKKGLRKSFTTMMRKIKRSSKIARHGCGLDDDDRAILAELWKLEDKSDSENLRNYS